MDRAHRLSPVLGEHLLSKLGRHREAFEGAAILDWIPYEIDVLMAEGVLEQRGPKGLHDFVIGNVDEAQKQAIFRPLLEGTLRVFGASPAGFIKIAGKLWELSYRNVLTPRPTPASEDGHARFHAVDVCDLMLRRGAAHIVLRAQCELAFRALGMQGTVSVPKVDVPKREIVVELEWKVRR